MYENILIRIKLLIEHGGFDIKLEIIFSIKH